MKATTIVLLAALAALLPTTTTAQQYDPALFSGMRWRLIGPFRGGRSVATSGAPGHPNVFYFGAVAGGVWKTENAGQTWTPIFDSQMVASIGAIAVAPSNPNVIYVGSGEADMRSDISYGTGMYKSTDGGRTWIAIGLRDTRQIGRVVVDPRNENRVFVAALGHGYGSNAERGVFRSTDGGRSWQKVLFKDENTGAIDLALDPHNPQTIYASLWQTRRPPWNVYPPSNGPGSGLYKSSNGGNTWQQITGAGFPSAGLGRIGVAVAASDPNRVYCIVDATEGGLYRSDDAGGTWRRMDGEQRIWQRGWYFGQLTVDPKNPDIVYVMNTSTYRSRDGGVTFDSIKGAPGGDDYHQMWVDPDDPNRMVLAGDQGVVVSVDGARNWSSWYNQPTAQIYHVAADNQFPFWVYGAQQDSGAVAISTHSNSNEISFRDWRPACAGGESGMLAPDPADANILYGGTVTRCDQTTEAQQNVSPTIGLTGRFRQTWTLPLVFSPADRALYFSHQMIFKTTDSGQNWQQISPDLTREDPGVPANLDPVTATDSAVGDPRRGVVYTIAPSPLQRETIWAGTDDGLIHLTRDGGKTWQNVTPPELTPWSKVGVIEASHFDANTAYAAVDRHRLDDLRPYIYRTRDGGKTWQRITNGLPGDVYVNAVREDPARRGLLFAGTELGAFVSFNDGDQWQSVQLNLPATSMRDFVIRGNDLVVATHGRSFWVLDDITPLRQVTTQIASASAYLYAPEVATRMRPGSDEGTPLPMGSPVGENPPIGATIDYVLKSPPSGPVTLEISDASGALVRKFSSADKPRVVDPKSVDIPAAWLKTPEPLSAAPGMHRFVWDLHYEAPAGAGRGPFGMQLNGPWVVPGNYTVRLTVNGRAMTQPLTVRMDPRIHVTTAALQQQFEASREITALMAQDAAARQEADSVRTQLTQVRTRAAAQTQVLAAVDAFEKKLNEVAGLSPRPGALGQENTDETSLQAVDRKLGILAFSVQGADAAPTAGQMAALEQARTALASAVAKWNDLKSTDLPHLNDVLSAAGAATVQP